MPWPHLQVSPHYDSLLGKLMVWAPTRQEAVQKMAAALQATKLQGTPNNLPLLKVRVEEQAPPARLLAHSRCSAHTTDARGAP